MWEQHLQMIREKMKKYGYALNNGVAENVILPFKDAVYEKFNYLLPSDYLEFLKLMNGFDFNGSIVYGIDQEFADNTTCQEINGFISYNEIWYENEWLKKYAFLGEGEMNWYVYNIENNQFQLLDKPSGSLLEEYSSFNALINYMFVEVLQ